MNKQIWEAFQVMGITFFICGVVFYLVGLIIEAANK